MPLLPFGAPPPKTTATLANPESLLNFWTALENRNAQRVKWLALGDSYTLYSAVATDTPPGTWADGYGPQAQNRLISMFPITGNPPCGNWYPVYNNTAPPGPSPWTVTGTWVNQALYGPNCLNHQITASYTATLTVHGTSANLWFAQDSALSGVFSWQVDAGAVTNVTVPVSGGGTAVDGFLTNISLGASGTHTITVRWVSGTLFFAGADVFDGDESVGLHLISAGHGAWASADWNSNDVAGVRGISKTLALTTPDLVTVMLGANDWATTPVSPVQFGLNLVTLCNKIVAAAPNASVVLIIQPRIKPPNTPLGPWSMFVAAIQGTATMFAFGIIDLSAICPWQAAPNQKGFYNGTIHPSVLGHHEIGQQVALGLGNGYGPGTLGAWPQFDNPVFSGTVNLTSTLLATTPRLPVGTYKITVTMTAKPTAASATTLEAHAALGTASGSLFGQTAGEVGFQSGETLLQRCIRQLTLRFFAQITSPGTITISAIATGNTVTVLNATDQNSYTNASGYFIETINNAI